MSDTNKAIKLLMARVEIDGVATASVSDGRVYIFSKKKLQEILATCEESGEDKIIVLVKDGSILGKYTPANDN